MPPKLNTKIKALGGSAPNTPTDSNAPEMKQNGSGKMSADGNVSQSVVNQGVSTRKQRGKIKETTNEKTACKGGEGKACGKQVLDDELGGIECEFCSAWFHPACQGLSEDGYNAIREHGLFWVCTECLKLIPEFRNMMQGKGSKAACEVDLTCLTRMEQKIDDLGKALSEQTKSVKEATEDVVRARKLYTDDLNEGDKKTDLAKIISSENIQKCFENIQSEKEEQEKRKRNLVVSNMPESEAQTGEDRKKEDITKLTDIIKEELRIHVKVQNAFRAGKKQENRPRLLIVTLESEACKWDVLKAARLLRESDNETVRNMYINKDMTVQERDQNKKLREEVKMRRSRGENVKIIKGKCVLLSDGKPADKEQSKTDKHSEPTEA